MNRVDHWAEALRLLEDEQDAYGSGFGDAGDWRRLRELAHIHATMALIPDSISGALDARAVIAERRQR